MHAVLMWPFSAEQHLDFLRNNQCRDLRIEIDLLAGAAIEMTSA
jgi:hypothetical protein